MADLALVLPVLRAEVAASATMPRGLIFFGIPAQISLVAVWAAIGSCHRLARVSLLALTIFVATFLAQWLPAYLWHDLLMIYLLQALLVWGGLFLLRLAGWLSEWPTLDRVRNVASPEHARGLFQFPLVEMFGWMTIAAIAAVGIRQAINPYPDDGWGPLLLNMVAVPMLLVALLGRCGDGWIRWVLALVIPIVIGLLSARLTAGTIDTFMGRVYVMLNLTQTAYLVLWYLVQRFDLAAEQPA